MTNPKYLIVDYKESWPQEFAQIARQLREGLGDVALRIDHIGSTAVPGLPAKDIIDIQITVKALDSEVIAALQALGYTLPDLEYRDHVPPGANENPTQWEKLLFNAPIGQRRTHTHVRIDGRANQRYPLLFRDYMRAHPRTAQAYARLKTMLAEHLAEPRMYPEVKDPAVDLIYLAAEEWATQTGWQPAESDA